MALRGINMAGSLREEYFDVVRSAGFDLVRLPVQWATVDRARVDWMVEAALRRGFAVVLDVHHFTGSGDELLALWKEIAPRYEGVTFELLNEPVDVEWWNELLPRVLEVVPQRPVIVGPGRWNTVDALPTLRLPDGDDLIVTVHYYSPFRFTHQGAGWLDGADGWVGTPWGTEAERMRVGRDLAAAAAWAHPRPLFVGEFGTLDRAAFDDRVAWTTLVRREAERLGLSWAYWDFATDFGAFDLARGAWREPLLQALIDP
jgi:endoglucanase